jgi:Xaa-Pro aminopeptidase
VTPHGLGLEHTDDPKPLGVQLGTKPDQVLEAGMVINVDMPYTEIGWGSLHIEDTALVTDDGHELLTTADLELRCVPG